MQSPSLPTQRPYQTLMYVKSLDHIYAPIAAFNLELNYLKSNWKFYNYSHASDDIWPKGPSSGMLSITINID